MLENGSCECFITYLLFSLKYSVGYLLKVSRVRRSKSTNERRDKLLEKSRGAQVSLLQVAKGYLIDIDAD